MLNENIFKNSSLYAVSSIIVSALPLVLLPILTRLLTPTEYGFISVFQTIIVLTTLIVQLSLNGALMRAWSGLSFKEDQLESLVSACLLITLTAGLFLLLLAWAFQDIITSLIPITFNWVYWAIFVSISSAAFEILLSKAQFQGNAILFAFFQILRSVLYVCITILFIYFLDFGALGRVYAVAIVSGVMLAALLIITREQLYFSAVIDQTVMRYLIGHGLSLLPHTMGAFLLITADKLLIGSLIGAEFLGGYYAAFQFFAPISLIFYAFNRALMPWFYSVCSKGEFDKISRIFIYYCLASFGLIFIGFFCLDIIFPVLVGENFLDSLFTAKVLVASQVFNIPYHFNSLYLFYARKTVIISNISLGIGSLYCISIFYYKDSLTINTLLALFCSALFLRSLFVVLASHAVDLKAEAKREI